MATWSHGGGCDDGRGKCPSPLQLDEVRRQLSGKFETYLSFGGSSLTVGGSLCSAFERFGTALCEELWVVDALEWRGSFQPSCCNRRIAEIPQPDSLTAPEGLCTEDFPDYSNLQGTAKSYRSMNQFRSSLNLECHCRSSLALMLCDA